MRTVRARVRAAADALDLAIGGLWQVWFAYREQHEATTRHRNELILRPPGISTRER